MKTTTTTTTTSTTKTITGGPAVYRDLAMSEFKRHYFHGLRNGLDSAQAASDARWKARATLLPLIHEDKRYKDDLEREEAWADALSTMLSFQNLLMFVPIDKEKIGPHSPPVSADIADHVEEVPKLPDIVPTTKTEQ